MDITHYLLAALGLLIGLFLVGPRPRLNPTAPTTRVPASLTGIDLDNWLIGSEARVSNIVDGAEARIVWHNPAKPEPTPLCFLYVHGFSASRQETAPVTELLAARYNANIFDTRLEGHGLGEGGMTCSAEHWLQSMVDAWEIASRLGERVVIVATSNGAPLSVWLASQPGVSDKIAAMLFMAPNFKIRQRFSSLLTWPWARYWVPKVIGPVQEWEPETEAHGKYWTPRYSTDAVIEMQKVVDWAKKQNLSRFKIPLAMMYLRNETTVDPDAAIAALNRWGSDIKKTIPVEPDGDAEGHVFAGHLTGAHRTDWTVDEFAEFLETALA